MSKHAMKNVASIFCGNEIASLLCLFIKKNHKHLLKHLFQQLRTSSTSVGISVLKVDDKNLDMY